MSSIMGLETGLDLSVGSIGGFAMYLVWIFGFIIVLGIAALIIWYFNQKKAFKEEIVIFENISGQGWVVREKDKARRIRLSADGTETLYLKNNKMPLTAYGRKMGTNQYWYAIGSDGGWYNFVLGDLDTKMGVLDIELIDRDIKYIMVAMLKNAEKEYGPKQSFMDKWGTWIFSLIWLIIGIAGASYLISQMGNIANAQAGITTQLGSAVDKIATVVGQLDVMSNGGSGIVSA